MHVISYKLLIYTASKSYSLTISLPGLCNEMIHTFVMHNKATRKVPNAVMKVNNFLFLLRILKSSESPVMTASMPPICTERTRTQCTGGFRCECVVCDVFALLICWRFLFQFYQDFHYVFLSTRLFPHKFVSDMLVTKQVLQCCLHHVLFIILSQNIISLFILRI